MHHPSFIVALSRIDLHANTDLFLPLSYVFVDLLYGFPEAIAF
jgi:hypothetical protein